MADAAESPPSPPPVARPEMAERETVERPPPPPPAALPEKAETAESECTAGAATPAADLASLHHLVQDLRRERSELKAEVAMLTMRLARHDEQRKLEIETIRQSIRVEVRKECEEQSRKLVECVPFPPSPSHSRPICTHIASLTSTLVQRMMAVPAALPTVPALARVLCTGMRSRSFQRRRQR